MKERNSYLRRQSALLSFLTFWNLWIFYLLYPLSWFPAGQSWQLSLCFILNCSKHVRKLLTLLSLKVAGTHPLVTPRPGDICCLSEIIIIVPEQLADCYNIWSFTASSWNPETCIDFFLLSVEVIIYVWRHSLSAQKDTFSPCVITSCFVYRQGQVVSLSVTVGSVHSVGSLWIQPLKILSIFIPLHFKN